MRPEPTSRPLLIEGLGRKMPAHVVDNAKLSELAGKSYLGIEDRCGVLTRHFADRPRRPVLGAQAPSPRPPAPDIDLIISASGTSHQFIPDQAVFIQRALGAGRSGIPCFSVHTSCLSFVTALDIAASHLASGRYRRILIVTSEIASAGLNLQDAESGPLFGDAAVAAVVRRTQPDDPVSPNAAIHRELATTPTSPACPAAAPTCPRTTPTRPSTPAISGCRASACHAALHPPLGEASPRRCTAPTRPGSSCTAPAQPSPLKRLKSPSCAPCPSTGTAWRRRSRSPCSRRWRRASSAGARRR
ncbi:MAG: hypothetical protein IPI35_17230 [Deltaproteobacteria bacterium]|nr:hypothetical protein [Deltaproteobacteria bacterium]